MPVARTALSRAVEGFGAGREAAPGGWALLEFSLALAAYALPEGLGGRFVERRAHAAVDWG
jgi:hypothetical protein